MNETNRERAIRWMEEAWNRKNDAVIDELMHPNCEGRLEDRMIKDREGFRQARTELLAAIPNIKVKVEQVVAEGDFVVLRWQVETGINGIGGTGTTWMKFSDGKIVWGCDTWNQNALMASLAAA